MNKPIFFTTYLIASLGLVAYGILALFVPSVLSVSFSLHVYQFPSDASAAVTYLEALFRLLGYLNFMVGLLCLYLLYRYRATQNLGFVVFALPLAYLGPIIFDNTVGSIGFFEVVEHILFGSMVIVGFIMLKYQEAV